MGTKFSIGPTFKSAVFGGAILANAFAAAVAAAADKEIIIEGPITVNDALNIGATTLFSGITDAKVSFIVDDAVADTFTGSPALGQYPGAVKFVRYDFGSGSIVAETNTGDAGVQNSFSLDRLQFNILSISSSDLGGLESNGAAAVFDDSTGGWLSDDTLPPAVANVVSGGVLNPNIDSTLITFGLKEPAPGIDTAFISIDVSTISVADADVTAPVITVNPKVTNDNTPELAGTIDDTDATIEVTVNGQTLAATNNGDGTWTLADNALSALPDGTYDVVAEATDDALVPNVGTDGTVGELEVDTTGPNLTVDTVNTSDNTPQLAGTVGADATSVDVTVNGETFTATITGTNWSIDWPTTLADGAYNISVTTEDAIGNPTTVVQTDGLTVDTTGPSVTVNVINTGDSTPQLTGTVGADATSVDVTVNGETFAATITGTSWSIDWPTTLAVGTYDVSASATDALGNVGADATAGELTIADVTPPVVTVNPLTTADITPPLSGTVNEAAAVQVTVDGQTVGANVSGNIWNVPDDTLSALALGTYDVQVTATDGSGNVGADATTDELTIEDPDSTPTLSSAKYWQLFLVLMPALGILGARNLRSRPEGDGPTAAP